MDAQAALTIGQNALFILIGVAAPVLGTVLLVGLVISLFQALTQTRFLESDQTRLAPWSLVGGSSTFTLPLSTSISPT